MKGAISGIAALSYSGSRFAVESEARPSPRWHLFICQVSSLGRRCSDELGVGGELPS